jgi:hypothetical protein
MIRMISAQYPLIATSAYLLQPGRDLARTVGQREVPEFADPFMPAKRRRTHRILQHRILRKQRKQQRLVLDRPGADIVL